MIPIDRFAGRLLVFTAILAIPFARMLTQHRYGVLYPEVGVAFLMFAVIAAALAAVSRSKWVFAALVFALCVFSSISAIQHDFFPDLRFRYLVAGMCLVLAAGIILLKRSFYTILLVFLIGGFVPDLLKLAMPGDRWVGHADAPAGRRSHVVHIIFDEMLGLAGAPADCAECVAAAGQMSDTLKSGNFRIYPRAFSNYNETRDSVPSILNGVLLDRAHQFVPIGTQSPYLRKNAYFDYYHRAGYDVRVYQMDYLQYAPPELPYVAPVQYNVINLSLLHRADFSWTNRLGQLFNFYVQSDVLWQGLTNRLSPGFWKKHEIVRLGPLAIADVWPNRMIRDIRNAKRNTLFFAHLFIPHAPYALNADGSVRSTADWGEHMDHAVADPGEYHRRYRLYAGQWMFLDRQLDAFVQQLKSAGLYDDATLILHGDHGSRLRLLRPEDKALRDRTASDPGAYLTSSAYDYVKPPSSRDLLNQFSALLAIKLPGAREPEVVDGPVSIVRVLTDTFHYATLQPGRDSADSAYLYERDDKPRKLDIKQAFEEGSVAKAVPEGRDSE